MSDSAVQPTEADARDLAAKVGEFQAALPEGQRALFQRLMADATGNEVQGFATMAEYGMLVGLIAVICSTPAQQPQPGGVTHPGTPTHPGTTSYGH